MVASRPVRRILYGRSRARGGHPSRPTVARRLQRPTRGCRRAGRTPPVWPCSRWGLPSHPGRPGCWCALAAPFHPCLCVASSGSSRSSASPSAVVLCGTFLRVAPTGCYPAPCPVESGRSSDRSPPHGRAGTRPPGRLATITSLAPQPRRGRCWVPRPNVTASARAGSCTTKRCHTPRGTTALVPARRRTTRSASPSSVSRTRSSSPRAT
jgi:hypothetical protein